MSETVAGFVLEQPLARGGMGVVYRGHEAASGRPVAVKLLLPGATEHARKRFQREAEAMLALDHPHVVRALAAGVDAGRPYLVLELLEGSSLQELVSREGPLPFGRAAELIAQVARGVEHAHQAGVIHRDLKPANVLLDARGQPRLTDFGLVRELDPRLSQTRLSQTGMYMGTPGYWAPEQAAGEHQTTGPAADVYGLGGLLFALLTGRAPKVATNLVEVMSQLDDPPPRPSSLRPGVPRALERLCLRCLERQPGDRPGSAAEVADALEAFLDGSAPAARSRAPQRVAALLAVAGAVGAGGWAARGGGGAAPSDPSSSSAPSSPSPSAWEEPADLARSPLDAWAHGESAYGTGWAQAVTDMRAWLEEHPGDARARAVLALAYARLGRQADAEDQFASAAAKGPHAWVQALRGQALLADDRARAVGLLREALDLDGDCLPALTELVRVATSELDFARGAELFARALELAPENPVVHHLGGLLSREVEDQIGHLDRALELEPRFLRALLARARLLLGAGRDAEARADVDRALALDDANFYGRELRAQLQLNEGDRDGWFNNLLIASTTENRSQRRRIAASLQQEATLRAAFREHNSALRIWQRLRELRPASSSANALWALGGLQAGHAVEEIPALEDAYGRDPSDPTVAICYARYLALSGQLERALALLDQVQLAPRDADALALRAAAYKASGQPARARQDLTRALEIEREHPHALVELAVLELESARVFQGLLVVKAAQKATPGQFLLWEVEGGLLLHGERYAEAVTAYEHVLAFEPERTSALANLMQALDQLDRDEEAKAIYRRLKDRDVTSLIRGVLDGLEAEGW